MKDASNGKRYVVHGHFYQPPREEPWLDLVPREPTAAPDHDWNERITRECYAPLARARVFDERGRLRRVLNTYAWCSFDVGPTLLSWFDQHAPAVRDAFIAGDREARARTGHGNALAMPYHHLILPLASQRDKVTEVRWGMRDFRERFGRDPEGMWLPETAADDETLQVLADCGIRFTVLAPHQVNTPPPFGRPGLWRGANGKTLAVFSYDGMMAHELAFGDLLRDAGRWHRQLVDAPSADDGGPTVISVATDGETFGHHHRFGDLALAALIDRGGDAFTSFAAILATTPPAHDVTLVSPSSWSCPHGVERWRSECGCRMTAGTRQDWRAPLRHALEELATGIHAAVTKHWPPSAGDLTALRIAMGANQELLAPLDATSRLLLEAETHALAMFVSCAWFFDDLARLEPKIVLRHAARALECLPAPERAPLEAALLATLAQAKANDPADGDGTTIWQRDVLPFAEGPARLVAAIAALRDLAPDALDEVAFPAWSWRLEGDDITIIHRRSGASSRWRAEALTKGVVAEQVLVRPIGTQGKERTIALADFPAPLRALLLEVVRPLVFDAALDDLDRAALRDGALDAAQARERALAGAWRLVARDGLDIADVVVHGALDLFDLDGTPVPDTLRSDAFLRMAAMPASPARKALGERFQLALPEAR